MDKRIPFETAAPEAVGIRSQDILDYIDAHSVKEVRLMCSRAGGFVSLFGTADSDVIHKKVDCVEIFCQSEEYCVIDGEMLSFDKLKMAIYPKQIKMRV